MEFETKDSGERVDFDSGMRRDIDTGKPRYDLIPDFMLERWAALMARGAVKYGENNWCNANSTDELARFKASALRHMYQWKRGDRDEDHAAAVIFNITAAEFLCDKIGVDVNGEVWLKPPLLQSHEVSDKGRVRSIITKKIYSQWKNIHGYMLVSLSNEQKRHYQVHRLVVNAFLGDIENMQVNHIDGCKTNNTVTNLEIVTRSENIKHAYLTGLMKPPRKGKITYEDAEVIRELVAEGKSQCNIADEYGISRQAVNDLVKNRTWKLENEENSTTN